MLKKLISTLLFVLPTVGWGWGPGYYIGTGLGADTTDYLENAYIKQAPDQPGVFSAINETHLAAEGLFGTLFGGYAFFHDRFYFAGEGNFNASTAKFDMTNKEFDHASKQISKTRFQILPSWGLSVLPGWLLLEETALIYGRFGYAGGIFVVDTSDTSLEDVDKVISGFRYGLGLEKRIYKNLGVRFEYSHIIYQTTTIFHVDTSNGAVTPKQTRIIPQSNQFEFSLIYRFDNKNAVGYK